MIERWGTMHDHLGDRLANAISHGLGLLLSITALIYLLSNATTNTHYFALSIYGTSLILLYLFSTIHHAIKMPTENGFYMLKSLDQIAIYILIAGTYTPLVLLGITATSSIVLLYILWAIALIGSILKIRWPKKGKTLHIMLYVIMGWSVFALWPALTANLSTAIIWYIVMGGLLYTGGIPFYVLSQVKKDWHYTHLIWHLFVIGGSVMHFVAITQIT